MPEQRAHYHPGQLVTVCLLRLGQRVGGFLRSPTTQLLAPKPLLLNEASTPRPPTCLRAPRTARLLKSPPPILSPIFSPLLEKPRVRHDPSPSHPLGRPDTCSAACSEPPRPPPPAPGLLPVPAVPHQRLQRACARAGSPPFLRAPRAGRAALIGRGAQR